MGIYGFFDKILNEFVYIGQTQDLKRRHKQHLNQSQYNSQQINRVIQNNPERYLYVELCKSEKFSDNELDWLEQKFIKYANTFEDNTKFNYCIGGKSIRGYKLTEQQRNKISEIRKSFYRNGGVHPLKNKKHSVETKKKISDAWTPKRKKEFSDSQKGEKNHMYGRTGELHHNYGKPMSDEQKKKISESKKGRQVPFEQKLAISKTLNTTGVMYVSKYKDKRYKQGFIWLYKFKNIIIRRVDFEELKKVVLSKKLPWIILEDV